MNACSSSSTETYWHLGVVLFLQDSVSMSAMILFCCPQMNKKKSLHINLLVDMDGEVIKLRKEGLWPPFGIERKDLSGDGLAQELIASEKYQKSFRQLRRRSADLCPDLVGLMDTPILVRLLSEGRMIIFNH